MRNANLELGMGKNLCARDIFSVDGGRAGASPSPAPGGAASPAKAADMKIHDDTSRCEQIRFATGRLKEDSLRYCYCQKMLSECELQDEEYRSWRDAPGQGCIHYPDWTVARREARAARDAGSVAQPRPHENLDPAPTLEANFEEAYQHNIADAVVNQVTGQDKSKLTSSAKRRARFQKMLMAKAGKQQ